MSMKNVEVNEQKYEKKKKKKDEQKISIPSLYSTQ